MSVKGAIRLGAEEVSYVLNRTARRTLAIVVSPAGALTVTAPPAVSVEAVEARLRKRGPWILKTLREFEQLRPRTPEREYVSGETYRFLGRQYRLKADIDARQGVWLTHDRLVVGGVQASEPARIRTRLNLWYQREARRVFTRRLDALAAQHGLTPRPRLAVRSLEKRWGSLSRTGDSLILNRRLIEADVDAIDFVIVHELCHVAHHRHDEAFYALLSRRMPDWARRKAALERWML